ncbi:endoplasmic reticulum junction formation protein lunapark-B [Galendromus occidentalis]|uniref:Endoplasmic reticulum junction formation protein lunapark n=1 Tax=Galendromus occidentalis TaxID=34638 RepID=A0AAJ6VXC3_9ACAR|nr:endoplasmic reticulum junction formation protein lunapark-B [Galendromus occidentalis]
MGAIISKFRKEPPTLEQQLEALEKKIFQIHEFNEATEHAMKKIIGAMLFYGWSLIIIGGVVAYFYFDHTLESSLICLAPVILAPFVLMGSKKLLQYYYNSRLERKKGELNALIKEKKSLIDKVKETISYKKAQEILEKFDSETRMRKAQAEQQRAMQTVLQQSGIDIRRRTVGTPMGAMAAQRGTPMGPSSAPFTPLRHNQFQPPLRNSMQLPNRSPYLPKTARPILPQDRGTVEKMIDYIVGEGPNNRYALICKKCSGHNGMALKEEFEFLAFKCCYCFHFNGARKQRPLAPAPPSLSNANSTTSLNDASRSSSPVPSGPSVKDSDQEMEADTQKSSDTPVPGSPKGVRPSPEGDETSLDRASEDQQSQLHQEHQMPQMIDESPEE